MTETLPGIALIVFLIVFFGGTALYAYVNEYRGPRP